MSTEEFKDFSSFQLLVHAAVQKAAEQELRKKQEPNPWFPVSLKKQIVGPCLLW